MNEIEDVLQEWPEWAARKVREWASKRDGDRKSVV